MKTKTSWYLFIYLFFCVCVKVIIKGERKKKGEWLEPLCCVRLRLDTLRLFFFSASHHHDQSIKHFTRDSYTFLVLFFCFFFAFWRKTFSDNMAQKKKIFDTNCSNLNWYVFIFFQFVVHFRLNTAASKNERDFIWNFLKDKMMLTFFDTIRWKWLGSFLCAIEKRKKNKTTKMFVHVLIPRRKKKYNRYLLKRWKNGREIVCWFSNGIFRTRCAVLSRLLFFSCFLFPCHEGDGTQHSMCIIKSNYIHRRRRRFCFVNIFCCWWPILLVLSPFWWIHRHMTGWRLCWPFRTDPWLIIIPKLQNRERNRKHLISEERLSHSSFLSTQLSISIYLSFFFFFFFFF